MKKKNTRVKFLFLCRAKEREKKKQKMRAALESGESRAKPSKKEMKKNSMAKSQCKVKVVVDSSFDDYMSERVIAPNHLSITINKNIR